MKPFLRSGWWKKEKDTSSIPSDLSPRAVAEQESRPRTIKRTDSPSTPMSLSFASRQTPSPTSLKTPDSPRRPPRPPSLHLDNDLPDTQIPKRTAGHTFARSVNITPSTAPSLTPSSRTSNTSSDLESVYDGILSNAPRRNGISRPQHMSSTRSGKGKSATLDATLDQSPSHGQPYRHPYASASTPHLRSYYKQSAESNPVPRPPMPSRTNSILKAAPDASDPLSLFPAPPPLPMRLRRDPPSSLNLKTHNKAPSPLASPASVYSTSSESTFVATPTFPPSPTSRVDISHASSASDGIPSSFKMLPPLNPHIMTLSKSTVPDESPIDPFYNALLNHRPAASKPVSPSIGRQKVTLMVTTSTPPTSAMSHTPVTPTQREVSWGYAV